MEETQLLMEQVHLNEDQFKEMVISTLDMEDDHYQDHPAMVEVVARVDEDLFKQINGSGPSKYKVRLWPRVAAIAAAVALLVIGVYFFNYNYNRNDIVPGSVGATLTLADGRKIKLSDTRSGEIATEAGMSVTKTADGQLVYHAKGSTDGIGKINTLSTARGETYIVTLPDRSKVWLNAASSLTYSANLSEGDERRVTLMGEAYFEVFKDKKRPFIVKTSKQEVAVLGTHFNISAYVDERSVKTTLLEGSVRVSSEISNSILRPGQQAELNRFNRITVNEVDTEEAVAWKDGYFMFNNEELASIMLKFSRWYNVEIEFQNEALKKEPFGGRMNRFDHISAALRILEMTGKVHFNIDGRKIVVTK